MGLTDSPVTGSGLVGTIAWALHKPNGTEISRAFEGNILSTGATLTWLAQLLGTTPEALDEMAAAVEDSGGIDIVPAFSGLGAPWWDAAAVATISGLQLGTRPEHLAFAVMESIVLQIEDVLAAAEREQGLRIDNVFADGGPSRNRRLMQLQADLSGRTVLCHDGAELSALGAATLAAEAAGIVESGIQRNMHSDFIPAKKERHDRRDRWTRAVQRARFRPPLEH